MTSRLLSTVAAACGDALAVVLPVACGGCGAPDRAVCDSCRVALAGPITERPIGDLVVCSGARYEGSVAHLIGAFKDGGRTDAARALGQALRRVTSAALAREGTDDPVLLVPVPSTAAAERRRGYSPLGLVAARARLPISRLLAPTRRLRDQSGLGVSDRAANLDGAFTARRRLDGVCCVLFDDVVTSGASLAEAARALTVAGADVRLAVTLAATPRRHAPQQGLHNTLSL